jgi:hypothetical protein
MSRLLLLSVVALLAGCGGGDQSRGTAGETRAMAKAVADVDAATAEAQRPAPPTPAAPGGTKSPG